MGCQRDVQVHLLRQRTIGDGCIGTIAGTCDVGSTVVADIGIGQVARHGRADA